MSNIDSILDPLENLREQVQFREMGITPRPSSFNKNLGIELEEEIEVVYFSSPFFRGVQLKEGAFDDNAYWTRYNPQTGKCEVYSITGGNHIAFIISNPELFGLTREEIEKIYAEHGERVGQEANAREYIIKMVAKSGWVRVRHYVRGNDYWSIQTDDTNRPQSKKAINSFLMWAITTSKVMNVHDSAIILGYNDINDRKEFLYQNGGVAGALGVFG